MGKMFLTQPEVFLSTLEEREGGQTDSFGEIEAAIKRLEARRERVDAAEAKSCRGYARGLAPEEAYRRVRAELRSARSRVITAETVNMLLPQLLKRIQAAALEDKGFVLECLGAETTVGPSGVQLSLAVPESTVSEVYDRPGWVG